MNCTAIIFESTVGAIAVSAIFHDKLLSQINVEPLDTVIFKIVDNPCANIPISSQGTFGIAKFSHLFIKCRYQFTNRHGFGCFWIEHNAPPILFYKCICANHSIELCEDYKPVFPAI